MKMNELQDYNDVIEYLNTKNRTKHLLLGNGFSMAYDSKIFSYNALSALILNTKDPMLSKLFDCIKTKNFELVMQYLDNFYEIARVFEGDSELLNKIKASSSTLKESLIDAVEMLHPEHVFAIPNEKNKKCALFLKEYLSGDGSILSTNYDLLLYWVSMRNSLGRAIDGFGRTSEDSDEFTESNDLASSELRWGKYKSDQTIFYLHGALQIYDSGIEIVKEVYDGHNYLLENIKTRMAKKDYPVFVTAGTSEEKLHHIMHNKYLTNCYDHLCSIQGSLVVFGFQFGDYDTHIIKAINEAAHYGKKSGNKLHSIYIGVYSEKDLEHYEKIRSKFKCKVNYYNAKTAHIWE